MATIPIGSSSIFVSISLSNLARQELLTVIIGVGYLVGSPNSSSITIPASSIVVARLLFNGLNGSSTIIDETGLNIWTSNGASLSNTQSYEGGSSLFLDGTGQTVSSPQTLNLSFTLDFTWEAWIYPTTINGTLRAILGTAGGGGGGNAGLFVSITNGSLIFRHWINGNSSASCTGVALNTWQHFKAQKVGTVLKLFLNNVQGVDGFTTPLAFENTFTIGSVPNNAGFASEFIGYIDQVILTKD